MAGPGNDVSVQVLGAVLCRALPGSETHTEDQGQEGEGCDDRV